jgi:histidinol-phosphate aminotransferase
VDQEPDLWDQEKEEIMNYFRSDLMTKKAAMVNVPFQKRMMCLNESSLDPYSVIARDFAARLSSLALNRYFSDTTRLLHQELADYCAVSPQQVLWGNGADDMLYHVFLAVREDADSFALSLAPSYFDYRTFCDAVDLKIRFHQLNEDFSFDSGAFIAQAQDPDCRVAILCNPNNPTGNLFPHEQLKHIVESLPHLLIVIDETYYEFSGATFAAELDQYPNLMLIRSFSKAFSAAGLRFGYAISSVPNIAQLKKVQTTFHTSILVQAFALSILHNRRAFQLQVQQIIQLRDQLLRKMQEQPKLKVYPSATNFLCFRMGESSREFFAYLQEQDIALRDVGSHRILQNCLRVSISCAEDVQAFVSALNSFL